MSYCSYCAWTCHFDFLVLRALRLLWPVVRLHSLFLGREPPLRLKKSPSRSTGQSVKAVPYVQNWLVYLLSFKPLAENPQSRLLALLYQWNWNAKPDHCILLRI